MTREAQKTWEIWTEEERNLLRGKGIDIGCGDCPIKNDCRPFDLNDGDANNIEEYVQEKFDYVFSSHCLEHMYDPHKAIKSWWNLVKPGGVMIIIVPDEDLYEQGIFPSQFNNDHKWTFTIYKRKSWSSKSINVLDLVDVLEQVENFKIELHDMNYNRGLLCFRKINFLNRCVRSFKNRIIMRYQLFQKFPFIKKYCEVFISHFCQIDQTLDNAMAQIQLRVHKKSEI